jgi:F-type H+-transporting ATPase subunit delta
MTNKTAATRYARAVFDVALKEKADLNAIEAELEAFSALFTEHPTLAKVLLNPAVPVPRKRAAVAEVVERAGVSSIVGKILILLAERDRLILLPDLVASYRDRLMNHQNVARAEVTTAVPLEPERVQEIQRSLARATGRTVTLTTAVDPAIIGGVVARIGSTVFDGSVTTHLKKMKQRLAERV